MRQVLLILGLAIGACVGYGLVHDPRVPEYFTVAHARIINSPSLTLIALAWGVVATWWMGAALGAGLAIAARAGSEPRTSALALVRPILIVLGVMAIGAIGAGVVGYVLAAQDRLVLTGEYAVNIPAAHHDRFFAA